MVQMLRMGQKGRRPVVTGGAVVLSLGLAAGVVGSGAVTAPDAAADTKDRKQRVDGRIDSLEGDLGETSAALSTAVSRLEETRAEVPAAQRALDGARAEEEAAHQRYEDLSARLRVARADEARAERRIRSTSGQIHDTRRQVAGFASQMYQEQGMEELSVAMSAESPDELASRLAMASTVMTVQDQSLAELATARASLTATQDRLRALRAEVARAQQQAKAALQEASQARAAAASAKARLVDLTATLSQRSAALKQEKAAERSRLKSMRAESRRLEEVLRERARRAAARRAAARRAKAAREAAARAARRAQQRRAAQSHARSQTQPQTQSPPSQPPSTSGGYLSRPSSAGTSSEFGYRYHPVLHYRRLHAGLDFAAACGTPVVAAASGTVVSAGAAGGAGNQVVIDHGVVRGVDLATVYDHLSSISVSGRVSRGQVIGAVGTTGLSTGCHLHFETRENGVPVNPRTWL